MYKFEFKISISQIQIVSLAVIFGYVCLAFTFPHLNFLSSAETNGKAQAETGEFFEIDIQSQAQQQLANTQMNQAGELYSENPDVYIFRYEKKKKKNSNSLDDFFEQLQGPQTKQKIQTVSHQAAAPIKINQKASIDYSKLIKKKTVTKKVSKLDQKKLKSFIKSHQGKFQGCYEKALLKDELLAGNATIIAIPGGKSRSNFKGIGRQDSIQFLNQCLKQRANALNFDSSLRGNQIKFSIYFKS